MKKSLLLTAIGIATPIIAIAPITTSCNGGSSSEESHFSDTGSGGSGGGGSSGGGSSTTESGVQTTNFTLTLTNPVSGELSVTATTTSGPTVTVVSTFVSGTKVTVTCRINVSDMSTSVSSKFSLTFHCDDWANDETISNFTITYTKIAYQDVPADNFLKDENGKLIGLSSIPSTATRLNIPEGITEIPYGVLNGKLADTNTSTKIKAIVIPATVTKIDDLAISNNSSINYVDISAFSSIPTDWGKNIFKGSSSTGTFKYKASYKETMFDWAFHSSGLNHAWITDTSWKCQQYINDRTFSLMGRSRAECSATGDVETPTCWGTGWILKDATPEDTTDYVYYVATNWHVKAGIQSCHMNYYDGGDYYKYVSGSFGLYYGDKSTQTTINGETGLYYLSNSEETTSDPCYTCCSKDANDGVWEAESNFRNGIIGNYYKSVDFNVCKLDFNNMESEYAEMPATIKTKLDNINNWNTVYGGINKVATMSSAKNKAKWVGGFPVDQESSKNLAKWENHSISGSQMTQYAAMHTDDEGSLDMYHAVNSDIGGRDLDFTAQYKFNSPEENDWMDGGASGSPLITTDLEICGIYWGGQIDPDISGTKNWLPMFSILNDINYKDFISDKYI